MVNSTIGIGDKVYIGGITDDDYRFLNHKTGYVDNITFSSRNDYTSILVDVNIDDKIHTINLTYTYKIDDLDVFDYDGLLDRHTPLKYYFDISNIVGNQYILRDNLGINYLCALTRNQKIKMFKLTGLN